MKLYKVILFPLCFMASIALSQNAQIPKINDNRLVLIKGISDSDFCGRLIGSRPEAAPLAWALQGQDKLTSDGIKRIKDNLSCFTATEDYCQTVNSFDLNPMEQIIEITHNKKSFGIVSSKPMNQDRMTMKLKKSNDTLKITSQFKNGSMSASVEFEFKYINGVCIPWAFRQSNGAGPIFDLKECSKSLTAECQKNPYWQFYQSQLSNVTQPTDKKRDQNPAIR